ncbi:hypothetical protein [Anaplasma phagocytophilum]|uniref:hypothetical protein n=1 Tax=Anaplasma phagocytophilum TaxID=948 RepID=UPI00201B32EC
MYKDLLLDKVRTLFTLLRLLKFLIPSSMVRFVVEVMLKGRTPMRRRIKLYPVLARTRHNVVVLELQAVGKLIINFLASL